MAKHVMILSTGYSTCSHFKKCMEECFKRENFHNLKIEEKPTVKQSVRIYEVGQSEL